MESKKIVVVGSYIVALVMDTDRIPIKGETLMGRNFRQTYGGKGSNQAVQAARLGAEVSFVGKIGNDSFGRDFVNLCKKEGVDHRYVFTHEKLSTASGFIICAEGHNIITIDIGALNEFGKAEIDQAAELFSPQSVVLIQFEIPMETALYAAQKAKEKGSVVILNPAPAKDLSKTDLSAIDFLTPNETEARICAGLAPNESHRDAEVGRELLRLGCKNVLITLGEKGCLLVNPAGETLIPAYSLPQVVDSTGAGDAFNGAFAVALSEGMPLKKAIAFGNAAGALACTKADTIPSFHNRQQIADFINKNSEPIIEIQ
ncbi:MAG: ribokinase [Bacteroidales bacterium]|nr:ribokinase [Bacteroidales bacterium]